MERIMLVGRHVQENIISSPSTVGRVQVLCVRDFRHQRNLHEDARDISIQMPAPINLVETDADHHPTISLTIALSLESVNSSHSVAYSHFSSSQEKAAIVPCLNEKT